MPANNKASVAWQIVFTFLPIVNLWAFYRIKKLRRYLLYVIAPAIIISIALMAISASNYQPALQPGTYDLYTSNGTSNFERQLLIERYWFKPISPDLLYASYLINLGLQGLSIYLVIVWSRQHNKQFDQPSSQSAAT